MVTKRKEVWRGSLKWLVGFIAVFVLVGVRGQPVLTHFAVDLYLLVWILTRVYRSRNDPDSSKSALIPATILGCVLAVQVLIILANPRAVLAAASVDNHSSFVKLLIWCGIDVNAQDDEGRTALMIAILLGRTDVVETLVQNGAALDLKDGQGNTALVHALRAGNQKTLRLLFANGVDVNKADEDGLTPLMRVVWNGKDEVALVLVDAGANVNAKDNQGRTPAMYAAREGNTSLFNELIKRGADPQAEDKQGATALLRAMEYERLHQKPLAQDTPGRICRSDEIREYLLNHANVPPSKELQEEPLARSKPEVRVIYLVPSDRQPRPEAPIALANGIIHLQSWYRDQVNTGKTFKLHDPIVEIIRSSHETSWFSTNPAADNPSLYLWFNSVIDASAKFVDPNYTYVIYVDVEATSQTVGGSGGVALLSQLDILGMIGQPSIKHVVSPWVGDLGHELGHALGLSHPPECDSHQSRNSSFPCQSLMYSGYLIYPNTYLLPDNKDILNESRFIVPRPRRPN